MEALQRLHNRGSISTGYNIDNSLKMENDNAEKIYRNSGLGSSVTSTKGTISYWHKTTELSSGTTFHWIDGTATQNHFAALNAAEVFYIAGRNESAYRLLSNRVFRDTSAWYHFVIAYDTTQATASDRIKLYVNGVQETSFAVANYPAQNLDLRFLTVNGKHAIGHDVATATRCGYYAEVYFLDGQTLAPTDFGEFDTDTGIWKPIEFTGSFGSNDYYLDFESSGSLGADASGNSNNFTLHNITSADQATDTPTNNFATWNVIEDSRNPSDSDRIYFNEGGTQPIKSFGTGWTCVTSTQAVSNGKWYWEGQVERQDGTTMWGCFPVSTKSANSVGNFYIGGSETSGYDSGCAFYDNDDAYYHDNTSTSCTISGGSVQTVAGDIIMIAIDMDNNKFYAGRNGQWFNSSDNTHANATGITLSDEEHFFAFAAYAPSRTYKTNLGGYTTISISSAASDANGYGTFEYAPPSGYYALCTKNLAEYG